MNIRARIIVRGKVQKGGYRYLVNEAAFENGLTGLVGNRDDGAVEIVCEGQKEAIQRFQRSIRIRDPMTHVLSMHVRYRAATGEFGYFDIIPEADPARATLERADAAASALRAMDRHITGKLDQRIGQVDRRVGQAGSGIRTMDSHITRMDGHLLGMDRNTGRRFDRLDRTYGRFGRTLDSVSKDMKGMNSSLRTVSKDIKGLKRSSESLERSSSSMASDIRSLRKAAAPPRSRPSRNQRAAYSGQRAAR